mgnify:CR=1 FL=1
MVVRTSTVISEESKRKAEEIKNALPFLKSFGAVVEYCITQVHEEISNSKKTDFPNPEEQTTLKGTMNTHPRRYVPAHLQDRQGDQV